MKEEPTREGFLIKTGLKSVPRLGEVNAVYRKRTKKGVDGICFRKREEKRREDGVSKSEQCHQPFHTLKARLKTKKNNPRQK